MRRLLALAISLIVLPTATVLVVADQAQAWVRFGCSFTTGSLKWKDATRTATYTTAAGNAVHSWDDAANALLSFTKVSSGANIVVADGNFGYFNGYDGIVQDASGNDPRVNCSSSGKWTASVYAWINTYAGDSYSTAKKQSLFTHEIGHALGLAHTSAQSCPNVAIMHPKTSTRYDICRYTTPRPDDIDGIEVLY